MDPSRRKGNSRLSESAIVVALARDRLRNRRVDGRNLREMPASQQSRSSRSTSPPDFGTSTITGLLSSGARASTFLCNVHGGDFAQSTEGSNPRALAQSIRWIDSAGCPGLGDPEPGARMMPPRSLAHFGRSAYWALPTQRAVGLPVLLGVKGVCCMLTATCHCGAVRVEVPRRPRSLTNCNCSTSRPITQLMSNPAPTGSSAVARRPVSVFCQP